MSCHLQWPPNHHYPTSRCSVTTNDKHFELIYLLRFKNVQKHFPKPFQGITAVIVKDNMKSTKYLLSLNKYYQRIPSAAFKITHFYNNVYAPNYTALCPVIETDELV